METGGEYICFCHDSFNVNRDICEDQLLTTIAQSYGSLKILNKQPLSLSLVFSYFQLLHMVAEMCLFEHVFRVLQMQ